MNFERTVWFYQAIKDAWKASNPGGDRLAQPHEEGGWVFLNLIDGSLSIERAKPVGGNFVTLNPAPDVDNSVVVAVFHTHPFLGGSKAKPSSRDKALDERDGVPDLVAANTGTNPDVFQIHLSGPAVRKHLGIAGRQVLFVTHDSWLTIASTLTTNYGALRWQPVMPHVMRNKAWT